MRMRELQVRNQQRQRGAVVFRARFESEFGVDLSSRSTNARRRFLQNIEPNFSSETLNCLI